MSINNAEGMTPPLFFCTSSKCAPAAIVSQGTREVFSTGSHAQKPPKLNASYAQAPPIRMPTPRMPTEKKLQIRALLIQLL